MSKALPAFFLLLVLAALSTALYLSYQSGYNEGKGDAEAACKDAQISVLTETASTLEDLRKSAQASQLALHQQIAARENTDNQTTKELRYALNEWQKSLNQPSHQPVVCRLPDNVMQQLEAATARANYAARFGVNSLSTHQAVGEQ